MRWTVGRKLGVLVLAMTLLGAGALTVGWHWLSAAEAMLQGSRDGIAMQVRRVQAIEVSVLRTSLQARHAMLVTTEADRQDTLRKIGELRQRTRTLVDEFESNITTDTARQQFAAVQAAVANFERAVDRVAPLLVAGRQQEAFAALIEHAVPARSALLQAVEEQTGLQEALLAARVDEAMAASRQAKLLVGGVMLLMLLVLACGSGLILRGLLCELGGDPQQVRAAADRIGDGDLATPVVAGSSTDASAMAAMERMRTRLAATLRSVQQGVAAVGAASREITQGNADLSSRTELQAGSLQQTAASMEQMSAVLQNNAASARQASQLAASAADVATRGGGVVSQVVNTMDEITASSRRVAEIIGVIDGIAFQTNILALNAAVEAARAGEQGRGFAVVAGEVRNLAQRSAQAAREIKGLIGDSVGKVENGSKLVNDAGATMQEIVTQVKRVNDLIGEITTATLEQSNGIGQVNQAVTQLDQMTQQNAALVEHSSAAADSLRGQADQLARAVAMFKLSLAEAAQSISHAQAMARAPATATP